ncbi:hypothetical protein ABGB18_19640 [Nonomuraea sp. B12E4]|uniref:hypothetical protein n=1 Tax=Nonomuraea sp. B12E4 TaxID=3153564 RepID=UPI00325D4405
MRTSILSRSTRRPSAPASAWRIGSGPYAYAAVADAPARSLWVAGACPLDLDGNTVAIGDYAGQAHQVMRNAVLAGARD